MILPINRSLVGARVKRISSARAPARASRGAVGGEGTFAERHGNGEVAPIPDLRVVLGAESVATTLDRKAIEAAMGESWLARFLKFGKPSRSFNCYARTAKAKRAA
jgi:hypothetical protein